MIWFFERGTHVQSYEIRRGLEGAEYELVVRHAGGTEHFERFTNATALIHRVMDLQERWLRDGWKPASRQPDPSVPPEDS
jgi:hypothetical protein